MKQYTIYNNETQEIYITGYNDFTAMCNLTTFREMFGDVVQIKWE